MAVAIDSLQHAEQEYQHLKTISESKSKFITLAGHKFRTPLSSINWNVELLESGELGKLTERSLTAVKAVHQNAESLVRLVNELIEVQALEDGTYVPQVALAAVSPLIAVRSAISASQEKIQQLKLDVSLENNLSEE